MCAYRALSSIRCFVGVGLNLVLTGAWGLSLNTAVAADITWGPADNPHILVTDVTVAPDDVLVILPGTDVRLDPGVSILIDGRLEAIGTESERISFTQNVPGTRWGAIVFRSSSGRISYAYVDGGKYFEFDQGSMVRVVNSTIDIDHSEFVDNFYGSIRCHDHSVFTITDCLFRESRINAIHVMGGSTGSIERNEVYDVGYDAIEAKGLPGGGEPGLMISILDNVVQNTGDDGIDTDYPSMLFTIAGNIVSGCADKGISISLESEVVAYNNIVYDCDTGISVQAGSQAEISNSTIYGCGYGLRVWQKHAGYPPTVAIVKNIVAWNCSLPSVYVEEVSTLIATYCDFEETFPGTGNISVDPVFVDAGVGNFRLSPSSPCIDAGTSDAPAPPVDFEGHGRWDDPDVADTGSGTITYYDIGADEYRGDIIGVGEVGAIAHRDPIRILTMAGTRGELTLVLDRAVASMTVEVFDVTGRRVSDAELAGVAAGRLTLDLAAGSGRSVLAAGIYLVRVHTAEFEALGKVLVR